jgi:hypothetical protein
MRASTQACGGTRAVFAHAGEKTERTRGAAPSSPQATMSHNVVTRFAPSRVIFVTNYQGQMQKGKFGGVTAFRVRSGRSFRSTEPTWLKPTNFLDKDEQIGINMDDFTY